MKRLEQIKKEFDIQTLKTLTPTQWCEVKRKLKSEDFEGFIYYYFRHKEDIPWMDPDTLDSGYTWASGGDTRQKLIAHFKYTASFLDIPKAKTYIHRDGNDIILIPAFKKIRTDQLWIAIRICMKE